MRNNSKCNCGTNQEELKRLYHYDSETGVFTFKERRFGVKQGSPAGSRDPINGYMRMRVKGVLYLAHRLAWLYVNGDWPKKEIDHLDRNRENNRISNLREVTRSENLANKSLYRSSKTGLRGVHWHKQHRKFCASIQINGKRRHVGLFKTANEAELAYKEQSVKLRGEFSPIK